MPKIQGRTLTEHRARVRRQVFEAFAALMADRPYDQVTLAEIASAAGVSRTAIYNHFPDKESIVLAFAADETDRYLEELDEALDGVGDPVAGLRIYVEHHLRMRQSLHFGLGPALYGVLSADSMVEIRKHVRLVERAVRALLHQGMAAGVFQVEDVDTTIALIHATLQVGPAVEADAAASFVLRAVGVR